MSAAATRGRSWAVAIKIASPAYLRYARWIASLLGLIVFALGAGSITEARLAPIIIFQSASLGHQEPDNRLCWDWHFVKTRDALAIGAYARLYVGDNETPILLGLEHGDGTPFGSNFNDSPIAPVSEPWSVRSCVQVPDKVWETVNSRTWHGPERLGIRPVIIYQDVPFWSFPQEAAWVDYYPPPKMDPGSRP